MADWHPILAAVEGPTGTWLLIDPQGREYGRVELRRVRTCRPDAVPPAPAHAAAPVDRGEGAGTDVLRYRATWRGELLGWATTLREACERVHGAYVRSHGPVPFAGYPDLRPQPALFAGDPDPRPQAAPAGWAPTEPVPAASLPTRSARAQPEAITQPAH